MTEAWLPPGPASSASGHPNRGIWAHGGWGMSLFPLTSCPCPCSSRAEWPLFGLDSMWLELVFFFFFPRKQKQKKKEKHMNSSVPSPEKPPQPQAIKIRATAARAYSPEFESSPRKAGGLGTMDYPFSKLLISHMPSGSAPSP